MLLTLDGSTRWPNRERLIELAQVRCGLASRKAKEHLEEIANAMADVATDLKNYFADREHEIAQRIIAA
ncbi:MAG: hypothetical protein AAFV69_15170 [Pseudomonadota bacterium]